MGTKWVFFTLLCSNSNAHELKRYFYLTKVFGDMCTNMNILRLNIQILKMWGYALESKLSCSSNSRKCCMGGVCGSSIF